MSTLRAIRVSVTLAVVFALSIVLRLRRPLDGLLAELLRRPEPGWGAAPPPARP